MSAVPHPRFRDELRDFWRFARRPRLTPRLPHAPLPAMASDWVGNLRVGSILCWVPLLWIINLAIFGPLAAGVASATGATHRLDPSNIPWMLAIVWAPIVEELMFRFWLRRPGALLWLIPGFIALIYYGRNVWSATFLAVLLALTAWRHLPLMRWNLRWLRRYQRVFPWVFYASTATFAVVHLTNFANLAGSAWWLWPVLVLPQFITGMVLGWIRVRRGIGAAILMHACFNAGPVLLIWALMRLSAGLDLPAPGAP